MTEWASISRMLPAQTADGALPARPGRLSNQ